MGHNGLGIMKRIQKDDLIGAALGAVVIPLASAVDERNTIARCRELKKRYPNGTTVNFYDFKMFLDASSNHDLIMLDEFLKGIIYEKSTADLIRQKLKKGGIFVDAGANNGYFSLLASNVVGKTGKIYAFEPSSSSFDRMRYNIALNKSKNIKAICMAVGNRDDKVWLAENNVEDGRNKISSRKGGTGTWVKMTPLDRQITQKADLIKIDIEGYESEAILGAKGIISNKTKLVIEHHHTLLKERFHSPDYDFEMLASMGFKIREITGSGLGKEISNHKQLSGMLANLYCYKEAEVL